MKNQSEIRNPKSAVVAGAGPAGASLAIRLAQKGFEVTLVEREKFPRPKLCGEFISPECLAHFRALGVLDEMLAAGGERIAETVFYAPDGRHVAVPSEWFGGPAGALGLSRAEMDRRLLERARAVGVRVVEETPVTGLLLDAAGRVAGVRTRSKNGATAEISADFTIDATGRANVLTRFAARKSEIRNPKSEIRNRLVGFKAHLENVQMPRGRCEIYFFRGGYGGLSFVENGLANHCFLIRAETVRKYIGQTNKLIEEVIFENVRARATMRDARPATEWLAVSIDGFGLKNLNPAPGLLAVGDAAAFIDPFTGSGMLAALEGAGLLAEGLAGGSVPAEQIAENYKQNFERKFRRRLRVCALMRRAAFIPSFAKTAISALGLSGALRQMLARSTRQSGVIKKSNT
ncbi:MAG: NAD(P)/FAD-dependent oxidoreductase [Acidobacteria bacterium]|nr:NAD(P)/FAD-dependent oxidoreductase [Acidobacteriota bacterium]